MLAKISCQTLESTALKTNKGETMSLTLDALPPNISRKHYVLQPSPEVQELLAFEEHGTLPKLLPPTDFRWLRVVLEAMGSKDPFLTSHLKRLEARDTLLTRVSAVTLPLLIAERDDFRTLLAAAKEALDQFTLNKPGSHNIERAIDYTMEGNPDPQEGYRGYRLIVQESKREAFISDRAQLVHFAEADKAIQILAQDETLLEQMGCINAFVLRGCVQGSLRLNYETLVLIKKVETVWRERNEAARAVERLWDLFCYMRDKNLWRRVVPGEDFYLGDWVFEAWRYVWGYIAYLRERDMPDKSRETDSGFTPPALAPDPAHWLAVAAKMWRLFWVGKEVRVLENDPARRKEAKKYAAYERLVEGHNAVVQQVLELHNKADGFSGYVQEQQVEFDRQTRSVQGIINSIDAMAAAPESQKRAAQAKIRDAALPRSKGKYWKQFEQTLTEVKKCNVVLRELRRSASAFPSDADPLRLGKSLEALGFISQANFMLAYQQMAALRGKALLRNTSLIQEWHALDDKKSLTRFECDFLDAIVKNDFVRPSRARFSLERWVTGKSPIDRAASDGSLQIVSRQLQENVDDDGDSDVDLRATSATDSSAARPIDLTDPDDLPEIPSESS